MRMQTIVPSLIKVIDQKMDETVVEVGYHVLERAYKVRKNMYLWYSRTCSCSFQSVRSVGEGSDAMDDGQATPMGRNKKTGGWQRQTENKKKRLDGKKSGRNLAYG
ncbi:hypothetical protein PspLS_10233 [Pyricularia sp. CBS 133598]|nr:hypothetical protein PspLS_10233 [Pyricularia sp. CBS 133598]